MHAVIISRVDYCNVVLYDVKTLIHDHAHCQATLSDFCVRAHYSQPWWPVPGQLPCILRDL